MPEISYFEGLLRSQKQTLGNRGLSRIASVQAQELLAAGEMSVPSAAVTADWTF